MCCEGSKLVVLSVVDLFAGCGGLGLGLEQAGFTSVFVNEIHDDARQTYLRNRRNNSWLQDTQNQSADIRSLTVWPHPQQGASSLHEQWKDVRPQPSADLIHHVARIRGKFGDISLVAGGPPCQGFSGIGHRRTFDLSRGDIPGNYLFRDMITVTEAFAPKAFIFENVRGLLSARWTPLGEKGEIWEDVLRSFKELKVSTSAGLVGYHVGYRVVRAKEYGVPQNRPRVIIVGVRKDIHSVDTRQKDPTDSTLGLIPKAGRFNRAPNPEELWGDLLDPRWQLGGRTTNYNGEPTQEVHPLVQELRRREDGNSFMQDHELTEQEYSRHSQRVIERFALLRALGISGGELPEGLRTKKFAQRVIPARWLAGGPSITATSLPDDYIHYEQNRAPTVREWARLQTFPDWYQFTGSRTTGGRRRAGDPDVGDWSRDLPKFTQIGNAVPVELGRVLGLHLRAILGETAVPYAVASNMKSIGGKPALLSH